MEWMFDFLVGVWLCEWFDVGYEMMYVVVFCGFFVYVWVFYFVIVRFLFGCVVLMLDELMWMFEFE